ncbi:hypothetical protein CPB86DRAFT_759770 [Serendipita vermifera]|nr:hypothetical protein CPB86DRAFT_759770 [Serendipita vermifera]
MSLRALTILSQSERAILTNLQSPHLTKSSTTFFALHAPTSNLESIFDGIAKLPSSNVVGCISERISTKYPFSLSLLSLGDGIRHKVWRSTIPGREKAQVGRWYSPEQISANDQRDSQPSHLEWAESSPKTTHMPSLPESLRDLDPKERPPSLLYLSDDAPEGLETSLSYFFPHASKLGLIASSTPFITGRPFTLYHNGSFHSSGALGIALFNPSPKPRTDVRFSHLEPLGGPKTVSSASSNILYALDGQPAASILAQALALADRQEDTGHTGATPPSQQHHIYLGVLSSTGQVCRTYPIGAGSPSRGALLIQGSDAPSTALRTQFFYLRGKNQQRASPVSTATPSNSSPSASPSGQVHLACSPEDGESDLITQYAFQKNGEDTVVAETFIASSEHGFSLSEGLGVDPGDKTWSCKTPFAQVSLSLS